jgi:hypothetical protein
MHHFFIGLDQPATAWRALGGNGKQFGTSFPWGLTSTMPIAEDAVRGTAEIENR